MKATFTGRAVKRNGIKIQSELNLTNSAVLVLPFFFFVRGNYQVFFNVAVFLLKYIGLNCTTGQEQVSLFRFIKITVIVYYSFY